MGCRKKVWLHLMFIPYHLRDFAIPTVQYMYSTGVCVMLSPHGMDVDHIWKSVGYWVISSIMCTAPNYIK